MPTRRSDGSPLVAFKSARDGGVPFSKFYTADADEEKCRAAEKRISEAGGSPAVEVGKAEDTVGRIANRLNPYGLHFAFLDPYNLDQLPFSVIETLARFRHMDMLIHVRRPRPPAEFGRLWLCPSRVRWTGSHRVGEVLSTSSNHRRLPAHSSSLTGFQRSMPSDCHRLSMQNSSPEQRKISVFIGSCW